MCICFLFVFRIPNHTYVVSYPQTDRHIFQQPRIQSNEQAMGTSSSIPTGFIEAATAEEETADPKEAAERRCMNMIAVVLVLLFICIAIGVRSRFFGFVCVFLCVLSCRCPPRQGELAEWATLSLCLRMSSTQPSVMRRIDSELLEVYGGIRLEHSGIRRWISRQDDRQHIQHWTLSGHPRHPGA